MRHDPQLHAVLQAYCLPIMRANWTLDPAGCKAKVVQHCADDLGVGILGQDNNPGPGRRRGVVWHRHLRQALYDQLVYGHQPFERRYRYDPGDKLFHLDNLGPRMPWTLAQIRLNPDSTVSEIVQTTQARPIPADRLVWYVNNLEGSNWAGISMLRAAFGAWLLKHETWRVHATSIRRFGMGVPGVEAPPGATQAQVQQAQMMASAMRAGDQAGVGLPQGFKPFLMGLSGSVPDALAFINYLDQAMAKMALAGLIDLGATRTASRALGETFMNLFLLSLQGVADELATVATSGWPGMPGILTGLVDVNFGEDEPVPRLVCNDVGENYEATADAIAALVTAKALTPDTDLDAWIRKTWRLPKAAPLPPGAVPGAAPPGAPGVPPAPPGPGAPAGPGGTPGGGSRPGGGGTGGAPAGPPPPPEQLPAETFGSAAGWGPAVRRQPSKAERAAGFNAAAHQQAWQTALDSLLASYRVVAAGQRNALVDAVAAAAGAGRPDRLALAPPPVGDGPDLITAAMLDAARVAAMEMMAEAAGQGVHVSPGRVAVDKTALARTAQARAAMAASAMAQAASGKAVQVFAAAAGDGGVRAGVVSRAVSAVVNAVAAFLDGLSDLSLRDQLGAALTAAQNAGRMAVLEAAPESAGQAVYVATEVLDKNTCGPCQAIDGHEFTDLAAAQAAYPTGGYADCEGFARCRGTVMGLWGQGEAPGWLTSAAARPKGRASS